MPLYFSALVSLVFYISTIKDISSLWTAVSMWHPSPCTTSWDLSNLSQEVCLDRHS